MEKIKKGVYYINNWYICKIKNKWYLLSDDEFFKYKDNLQQITKDLLITGYHTKKQLIFCFKNETFYKHIFEGV